MALAVIDGASLMCPFGTAPGSLKVTSQMQTMLDGRPVATIKDGTAANVTPFAMCTSLANPAVAAATAAALGVLTPQPCQVVTAGSWLCANAVVYADGIPCLTNDAQLMCTNGMGCITIVNPAQIKGII